MKDRTQETEDLYSLDISEVEWVLLGDEGDLGSAEIADLPNGAKALRSKYSPGVVLRYTAEEWGAFVKGAKDGEFDLEEGRG